MIGRALRQYEIVCQLGAGGMGEVYRARDTQLGREVAIEFLPDAFSRDGDRLARFEREAKLLASLNHPKSWGDGDGHHRRRDWKRARAFEGAAAVATARRALSRTCKNIRRPDPIFGTYNRAMPLEGREAHSS
jgi:serine/threonine protein kinase